MKDVNITSCESSNSKIRTIKTYSLDDDLKKKEREAAGLRRKAATTAKNKQNQQEKPTFQA